MEYSFLFSSSQDSLHPLYEFWIEIFDIEAAGLEILQEVFRRGASLIEIFLLADRHVSMDDLDGFPLFRCRIIKTESKIRGFNSFIFLDELIHLRAHTDDAHPCLAASYCCK
ncbi:hypothetical protein CC117_33800 [Parafrankia colletiae]|uniref:Uncharacterized protein n=1 Tax=Parafrankia colletiae TaxID=573497 RepID=A0A1S1R143_9ACTN|nr:hypothetical protein CC117_33800 [Parafrankia colletiae]